MDPAFTPSGPAPAPWEDQIFPDGPQLRPSAFHVALASSLAEEDVLAIANRAGLRAVNCDRGGVFRLVEVWIDNTILFEVLCGAEVDRYKSFMNPAGCAAMFGPGVRPQSEANR